MQMNNLLLIGQFAPGGIERYFIEGLQKCGAHITTYDVGGRYYENVSRSTANRIINKISPDFFYRPLNEQLLKWVAGKQFDAILVFKGMELFPATVDLLRRHGVVLANFNGDHPFEFYSPGSGNKNVADSIPYYDVHFSYAKKIVCQLQQRFAKTAYCIPFGYSSQIGCPSGVASLDYHNRVLFVGAYDEQRASYLNRLRFKGLDIYGNLKWRTRTLFKQKVHSAYRNRSLLGNDYAKAAVSSTCMINLLRQQNIREDSHNMRTFEVPGYGGLLISQRTTEQQEYFEEDREAVYFDTVDELNDKLCYLCKNDEIVRRIKRAGHERALKSDYSYDNRSRQLFSHLQYHFNA